MRVEIEVPSPRRVKVEVPRKLPQIGKLPPQQINMHLFPRLSHSSLLVIFTWVNSTTRECDLPTVPVSLVECPADEQEFDGMVVSRLIIIVDAQQHFLKVFRRDNLPAKFLDERKVVPLTVKQWVKSEDHRDRALPLAALACLI